MYLIKGHIISLLHFVLSTSSFTVLILLNILYSCTLSGSGNKIKSNQTFGIQLYNSSIKNDATMNGSYTTWKKYLFYLLEPVGGLFFLNCNYEVSNYTIYLNFIRNVCYGGRISANLSLQKVTGK